MLLASCQNPMKEENLFSNLCLKWHKINSHSRLLFSYKEMHTFKWNFAVFHSLPKGDNMFSYTCEIVVISQSYLDLIVFIKIWDKWFQFYFVGYCFFFFFHFTWYLLIIWNMYETAKNSNMSLNSAAYPKQLNMANKLFFIHWFTWHVIKIKPHILSVIANTKNSFYKYSILCSKNIQIILFSP